MNKSCHLLLLGILTLLLWVGPAFALDSRQLEEASVRIMRKDGTGSGFIINTSGNIVTNEHVVRGADRILVFHRQSGRTKVYLAELIHADSELDLAVIQVKALKVAAPLKINLTEPDKLQAALSMGYPGITDSEAANFDSVSDVMKNTNDAQKRAGVDITEALAADPKAADFVNATMTQGSIQRISTQVLVENGRNVKVIDHNLNIQHGNSGGPLLDRGGNVIGVVGRGVENRANNDKVSWAIAGSELVFYLNRLSVPFLSVSLKSSELEASPALAATNKPPLSRQHLLLVSIAGASALVALGLGLAILLRRAKNVPESFQTRLDRAVSRALRLKRGGGDVGLPPLASNVNLARAIPVIPPPPAELVQPAPPPAPPLSTTRTAYTTWELHCEWPGGQRQVLRLSDELFRASRGRPILGRKADFCHLVIEHDSISRQHLHFRLDGAQLVVADRHSSNGTAVNGRTVEAPFRETPVRDGDSLTLGEVKILLRRGF